MPGTDEGHLMASLMQWSFKLLAETGFMCSEPPTTGAVLRLEIKNMLCVCAEVPYHDWARYNTVQMQKAVRPYQNMLKSG